MKQLKKKNILVSIEKNGANTFTVASSLQTIKKRALWSFLGATIFEQ